jgi:hypothetical protein
VPTTLATGGHPAPVQTGRIQIHNDVVFDRQGNLIAVNTTDGVSQDSLYFKSYYYAYLMSAVKGSDPSPANRTPMSYQSNQSVVCMDPGGSYVYEVSGSSMRRFSTVDGSYASYTLNYSGNGACGTDGNYIYVPNGTSIYKYTMTGTYVNTTTINYTTNQYAFGVANDTLWAGDWSGTTYYGYACSKLVGGSISYDATWAVGGGSATAMNIAFDGTYYYIVWGGYTSNTFKRFYANRTLFSSGTAYLDGRSVMCLSTRHDVGVSKLLSPTGNVDSGASVTPACSVYNYGNQTETYKVRLRIGPSYVDSATVTSHAPLTYKYASFTNWVAGTRGTFAVSCSTELAGDGDRTNDPKRDSVKVQVKDVGVTALGVPGAGATYPKDTVIAPKATWRNYGSQVATFEAWMILADPTSVRVYSKTVVVPGLAAGGSLEVPFPVCTLKTAGAWTTRCSSYLAGDVKRANDTLDRAFTVTSSGGPPPGGGWRLGAPMPLPPSGKKVKDGGWMCFDGEFELSFAAKGNKTGDFYHYDLVGDTWHQRASIPPGTEAKLPSKGAKGCSDMNGFLYATKGNNTLGYWMYDIAKDSWYQKKDVPLGTSNKKVKGGTDIIHALSKGLGYAYLLKGYKNEFLKYNPREDAWIPLPDAPIGQNMKWDKGSWIAYDGLHTLFAHKAKYHEFYSYDTDKDSWNPTPLTGMPLAGIGGSKKSKDGGCGTYKDSSIYALKGGNTQQFFQYLVAGNSWVERETVPKGPSGKKVGKGADITTAYRPGDMPGVPAEIPALKGNGTSELWIYGPVDYGVAKMQPEGALAHPAAAGQPGFSLAPNPLAGGQLLVRYALPVTGVAQVRVYDVSGQAVLPVSSIYGRTGTLALDVTNLSAGVYLVKLEAGSFASVRKLVIDR